MSKFRDFKKICLNKKSNVVSCEFLSENMNVWECKKFGMFFSILCDMEYGEDNSVKVDE